MSKHKNEIHTNEQGLVAIIVTVILMIVISLITLGFAKVTRTQQRTTLDRQLSSQAFYAAESGVNYAQGVINQKLGDGLPVAEKQTCEDTGSGDYSNYALLSSTAKVTCLLVTTRPLELKYNNVGLHASVANIKPESAVDSINVSWSSRDESITGAGGCTGAIQLPQQAARSTSCRQPLLRVDLVPLATPNAASTMTAFLSPTNSATSPIVFSAGIKGVIPVRCISTPAPDTKACTANVSVPVSDAAYGIRVMSVYDASNVVIFASNGGIKTRLKDGSQVTIDSTAKSVDVLRRVQVIFTPTQGGDKNDDFAITASKGICKRFAIQGTVINEVQPATPSPICLLPLP